MESEYLQDFNLGNLHVISETILVSLGKVFLGNKMDYLFIYFNKCLLTTVVLIY